MDLAVDLIGSADSNGKYVKFTIADTGIGMSREGQRALFKPFSQAETSTTRRFGGSGLGLAISNNLVNMMGGVINVESELGKGTEFSFSIPVIFADGVKKYANQIDLSGLRVLTVFGIPQQHRAAVSYLKHNNATVDSIETLEKVEEAALKGANEGNPYDVIVLGPLNYENIMPEDGGSDNKQISLMNRLRKHPDTRNLRYVVPIQNRMNKRGLIAADAVVVEALPFVRSSFVRGVAVAAGRESPDIAAIAPGVKIAEIKAPTIEQAEQDGQLILLAEDNETNQQVISRQLDMLGYAVVIKNDGLEALAELENRRYGLLLTDCHMPNMDGFELTRQVRAREEQRDSRMPIIAITANSLQGEADRCLTEGMDGYLSKPVTLNQLKMTLSSWLKRDNIPSTGSVVNPHKGEKNIAGKRKSVADVDEPAIDPNALTKFVGDDPAIQLKLLKKFVAPAALTVEQIDSAFVRREPEDIIELAHKLKSSARTIGANVLSDISAELESAGKSEDWGKIEVLSADLVSAFEPVKEHIEQM